MMRKKKILVVDDEDDIRYVLKKFLREKNYEVIEAKGGSQCLELLEKEKPDLVILDILMPGMNGWEVCRRIREIKFCQDIPVSMLTVLCDTEDRIKSLKYALADAHLCKPIDFPTLSETIERLIAERRKRRRPRRERRPPKEPPEFFTPFKFGASFSS